MTTRDTPEAALATALPHALIEAGLVLAPCDRHSRNPGKQRQDLAAAILAALDGWTLVRGGGDVIARGIELAHQQAAEIARLRAALVQAHERMDVAWNVMHPGDLTLDEREAIAQALWFGMAELDALAPSEP